MSQRVGQVLSVVFVLGFLGWLGVAARAGREVASSSSGSPAEGGISAAQAPCQRPVGWYVADVDPRFGVTRDWVTAVAREASEVWGPWEGQPLLEESAGPEDGGVPIRVAYDERQDRLEDRVRRERALRALDDSLQSQAEVLAQDMDAHRRDRRRAARMEGVPSDTLNHAARLLDERAQALDSARVARDEAWDVLLRDFPTDRLEAAVFRVTESARSGVVHREIRVFTFRDREELVWTLAHEFGHALGVEHVDDAAALMGGEQSRLDGVPLEPELSPADRRALARRCDSLPPRVAPR